MALLLTKKKEKYFGPACYVKAKPCRIRGLNIHINMGPKLQLICSLSLSQVLNACIFEETKGSNYIFARGQLIYIYISPSLKIMSRFVSSISLQVSNGCKEKDAFQKDQLTLALWEAAFFFFYAGARLASCLLMCAYIDE